MMFFSNWVDLILKAQGHRYLKRIPYMSGGKRRYRYIYKVTHTHRGRQAFDEAHLVEGTAFMLHPEKGAEFHGHITNVSGDQVTYRIDDGARKGEEVTVSKSELLAQLNEVHDIERGVSAEREKVRSQIEQARKTGSEKQVRRLEERLARLGGGQKRAESKESDNEEISRINEEIADIKRDLNKVYEQWSDDPSNKDLKRSIEHRGEELAMKRRELLDRGVFDGQEYPRTSRGDLDYSAFTEEQLFKLFADQAIYIAHILTSNEEYNALDLETKRMAQRYEYAKAKRRFEDAKKLRADMSRLESKRNLLGDTLLEESLEKMQGFPQQGMSDFAVWMRENPNAERLLRTIVAPTIHSAVGTKNEMKEGRLKRQKLEAQKERARLVKQLSATKKGDPVNYLGVDYIVHKVTPQNTKTPPHVQYDLKLVDRTGADEALVRRAPPIKAYGVTDSGEYLDLGYPDKRSENYHRFWPHSYQEKDRKKRAKKEHNEALQTQWRADRQEWDRGVEEKVAREYVYPLPERLK